jgi:hypothetical protein
MISEEIGKKLCVRINMEGLLVPFFKILFWYNFFNTCRFSHQTTQVIYQVKKNDKTHS